MKNLSIIFFFLTSLTLNAQYLDYRSQSEVSSKQGAWVFKPTTLSSGEIALKPVFKLKKGHLLSFRPSVTFKGGTYLKEDGTKKVIRGRYFGSILIDENSSELTASELSKIRDLNSQKIYLWEWHIDKSNYIQTTFNQDPITPHYTPEVSYQWDSVTPDRAWSAYASSVIVNNKRTFLEGRISDLEEFCPGISKKSDEKKTEFWIRLLNALSFKESKFDPLVTNNEGHFGDGKLNVTSRGLFQMSYNSTRATSYRRNGCDLSAPSQLHNPYKNISCALSIFKTWLKKDKCISCKSRDGKIRGIARYWSPLRSRYQVPCSVCSSGQANIGYKSVIIKELSKAKVCQ
jgi:hypothetical protein